MIVIVDGSGFDSRQTKPIFFFLGGGGGVVFFFFFLKNFTYWLVSIYSCCFPSSHLREVFAIKVLFSNYHI